MYRLIRRSRTAPQRQRGITLIESLVAIIVAALGILGILGVQMRTLTDTQTTVRRAQAVRLIEDLQERVRVNPNGISQLANYTTAFDETLKLTDAPDCSTKPCSAADLAKFDKITWKDKVVATLPLGQANIFLAPGEADGNRRLLGVMISWRENERSTFTADDKKNIDATLVRAADGTFSTGAGANATNACPADRTCHLQYIPVAARCTPDSNFPGQFFCAGV